MTYCFDLDGTLCITSEGNYVEAQPIEKRIQVVNKLYEDGHYIIIDTARGKTTGIDWTNLTVAQLKSWGVKYNELIVGKKPYYDILIDDKCVNDSSFFNNPPFFLSFINKTYNIIN